MWIAFKNYYLRDEGQHIIVTPESHNRCELLSKIIIFVMKDNVIKYSLYSSFVVNCFQKLLSSWWRTTLLCEVVGFKSCELLSKIIIFVMKDNKIILQQKLSEVVNCFQKLLSSWWRTTHGIDSSRYISLWIAFKNYYLRDEGQRKWRCSNTTSCCELLSKIIIFVMKDNFWWLIKCLRLVVNCFQKLLSSWWRTTVIKYSLYSSLLWIAFKNYYLRDEGQPERWQKRSLICCELLSKIIIFVMKDNGGN